MKLVIILGLLPMFLIGCGATVPHYEVWRPWTRTMGNEGALRIGQSIQIQVEGETDPLLGSERLLERELASIAGVLLVERGYVVADSGADSKLTLRYRTESADHFSVRSHLYTSAYAFTALASQSAVSARGTSGLGVSVASAVADMLSRSESVTTYSMENRTGYIHTLCVEYSLDPTKPVWKGESIWMSDAVEIAAGARLALQIIFSDIPFDSTRFRSVPMLKDSHVDNFFTLCCATTWFSCPSLPYRIYFASPQHGTENDGLSSLWGSQTLGVGEVKNSTALPAYVDLVQTAEYAVPLGSKDYSEPLDLDLWKKVMLGGQYLLGPDSQQVNVLLQLDGKSYGYEVKKAWLASEAEYTEFETRLTRWQEALRTYFDMFEE